MAKGKDSTDVACEQWAVRKRELLGVTQLRGFLGPMRCTLGARRDLHHGSRTERVEQHWPEFPFEPGTLAYVVNEAVKRMPDALTEIMVAHYVVLEPRDRGIRAELMGLSRRQYWEKLGRAKAFVQGALAYDNVRTKSENSYVT